MIRKSIIIILLIIMGFCGNSDALLRAPSHVAFFRFENAVTDNSGRGNNGTNSGTTDVAGKFSRARSFDGVDDYITLTQNYKVPIYPNSTTYSVAFWYKFAGDTTKRGLYEEIDVGIVQTFFIGKSTANKALLYIEANPGGVKLSNVVSTTTIADGTWHHIAWVDNNGTAKLYIDGVQDATNFNYTRTGTFIVSQVTLGQDGSSSYGKGDIDEFMIFDKVLTLSEIKSIMLSFSPGEF